MKPAKLKPGQRVIVGGFLGGDRAAEFVRRYPRQGCRPPINVLRFDTLGECQMSDVDLARRGRLAGGAQ